MLHSLVFKLMYGWMRLDEWLRIYSSLKKVGSGLQYSTQGSELQCASAMLFPGVYFACTADGVKSVARGSQNLSPT